MIKIAQVVLFMNPENSRDLGRAVWAAFEEMEAFYNSDKQRAVYTRDFISEGIPDGLRNADSDAVLSRFSSSRGTVQPERSRSRQSRISRTLPYKEVVDLVREVLPPRPERADAKYLIVTDLELIPPKEWRYIVFDGDESGVVISKAPADPRYWSEDDEGRVEAIKHRVRSAGLNVLGLYLGLTHCNNEECFMFSNIDSVTRLDRMVKLGPEHNMHALEGHGFAVRAANPGERQPIESNPAPIETA